MRSAKRNFTGANPLAIERLERLARNLRLAKVAAHILAAVPLALLVADVLRNQLGADPVRAITHRTGWWALSFLLLSLTMTPLRRLSGVVEFIRFRRLLGLWAFTLATLHFATYVVLDLQGSWRTLFPDIVKRPYITVGFLAWLLLVPLAITSTQGWINRLKKRWAQLHKLVYLIALLAVLHFFWLVKKDLSEPIWFALVLVLLLLMRIKRAQLRSAPAT